MPVQLRDPETGRPDEPRPSWFTRWGRYLRDVPMLAAIGALASLAFVLVHGSLIDDSYITMAYARNVAFHAHWGLVLSETANSATSPLNVLLLALITVVVRDPVVAVGVLFVVSLVLTSWWLAGLARRLGLSRLTPWIGTLMLMTSPLMLSTVGLEPYLAGALLVGLVRYGASGRPVRFGVVAGLVVLARPDLGVVVAITSLGFGGIRRALHRAALTAIGVVTPWLVFSWFALGSALPDTLFLKAGQGAWAGYNFGTGPIMYVIAFPSGSGLSFLPVALGAIAVLVCVAGLVIGRRGPLPRTITVAGLAVTAHYGVYAALATPPYHWYYAPMIVGMTICTALVVGRAVASGVRAIGIPVAVVAAVAVVGQVAIDVQHGMPWTRSAIGSNWAAPAEYARIGHEMRAIVGDAAVGSPGEIGTIAYYCECTIVDVFSDRGRMIELLHEKEAASGRLGRALMKVNYLNLDRSEAPRPITYRLEWVRGEGPTGPAGTSLPGRWPARHWAEGPGRMLLLPVRP